MHEAVLSFDYPDESRARVVERSVRRELGGIDGDRSRATLERADATLTVRIEATDLVGLRAGLNTWQGLIAVAEEAAAAAGG